MFYRTLKRPLSFLPWTIAGIVGLLGYSLLRNNRRLSERVTSLELQLEQANAALASPPQISEQPSATEPANEEQPLAATRNKVKSKPYGGNRPLAESRIARNGLAKGEVAPSFSLPRLGGGETSLDEFRGQPVLLVFSDPECGPCNYLAPRLEKLSRRTPDIQVLMVSRGSVVANMDKAREHGLTFPILLQRQWEISRLYAMFATPIGYLIDEDGLIASNVAGGAEPILNLLVSAAVMSLLKETKPQADAAIEHKPEADESALAQ